MWLYVLCIYVKGGGGVGGRPVLCFRGRGLRLRWRLPLLCIAHIMHEEGDMRE